MDQKQQMRMLTSFTVNAIIVLLEAWTSFNSLSQSGLSFFQFYTNLSNLFAMVACLIVVIATIICFSQRKDELPSWVKQIKYMASCCLTLTFIVVATLLAPQSGYKEMMFVGHMFIFHTLCPILCVASMLLFERKPQLKKNAASIAMLPTLCYGIVFIILNIAGVADGPYFFLRVRYQSIWASLLWFLVVIGGAYLFARLIQWADGKLQDKQIKTA